MSAYENRLRLETIRKNEIIGQLRVDLANTNRREEGWEKAWRCERALKENYSDDLERTSAALTAVSEWLRVVETGTNACNDAWYRRSLELCKKIDDGLVALVAETERANRWELAATNADKRLKEERGLGFKSLNVMYGELVGLPEMSMRIRDAIRSLRRQLTEANEVGEMWRSLVIELETAGGRRSDETMDDFKIRLAAQNAEIKRLGQELGSAYERAREAAREGKS